MPVLGGIEVTVNGGSESGHFSDISLLFSDEFSSLVGCGRASLASHDSSRQITFWVAHTRKVRPLFAALRAKARKFA
jgi:hypothetical protein